MQNYVILHNIRSSHNVGSMFRTSDALGINKVFLTGYTPAPKDQFGRINKEIAKVALGAEQTIPWESVTDFQDVAKKLKASGFTIIAIEQHARAEDYKKIKIAPTYADEAETKTAFVFGNEVDGLSEEEISLCDRVAYIPMRGGKESLNVSVAFGIALARILNL